jgi:progressive ankylosis protein
LRSPLRLPKARPVEVPAAEREGPPPSYGEILTFFFPLAISWLFMAFELPITSAVVSRSAAPEIQTAAMLMLGGLALWIESPVIDLLATSTTLTKSPRDFAVISRFVWWMMGLCTVVHAAVALTPLWGLVTLGLLGVPPEVSEAARIPMAIMIPWSAFIGWRRYLQGILIRFGRTRLVGWGTGVRVATMALASFSLFISGWLTGVEVAAVALTCSVCTEALFIHWASRETVRTYLVSPSPLESGRGGETTLQPERSGHGELTMGRLLRFHLPLTATTATFMASLPLSSAAIARAHDGVSAMAAWQVASSLAFLHRTVVFALPEPVIALYKGPRSAVKLARFCAMVGLAGSLSIVAFALLGLDRLFFRRVVGAPESVVGIASFAYLACVLLPTLGALQSYLRGMLTAHHRTASRFSAVIVSTAVLAGVLFLGVALGWSGVVVAAAAVTLSAAAELAVLGWSWTSTPRLSEGAPSETAPPEGEAVETSRLPN